jgi:PAS domain S-box-containing protein
MEIPDKQLLDKVQDAVVTLDTEWRVTYLNRAAARFAGRPVEELLGKSTWDIFPHACGNVFYTQLQGVIAITTISTRSVATGRAFGKPCCVP